MSNIIKKDYFYKFGSYVTIKLKLKFETISNSYLSIKIIGVLSALLSIQSSKVIETTISKIRPTTAGKHLNLSIVQRQFAYLYHLNEFVYI